jgi:hypothetical protein
VGEVKQIVKEIEAGYGRLSRVVDRILVEEKQDIRVGDWGLKEILGHITEWEYEEIRAINDVIEGKVPWYTKVEFIDKNLGEKFNQKAAKEYKKMAWEDILTEWRDAYRAYIRRVRRLTEEQLDCTCGTGWWGKSYEKAPVTVRSFFDYRHEGLDEQSSHAKQLEEALNLTY